MLIELNIECRHTLCPTLLSLIGCERKILFSIVMVCNQRVSLAYFAHYMLVVRLSLIAVSVGSGGSRITASSLFLVFSLACVQLEFPRFSGGRAGDAANSSIRSTMATTNVEVEGGRKNSNE